MGSLRMMDRLPRAMAAAALVLSIPAAAVAQTSMRDVPPGAGPQPALETRTAGTVFKCQGNREILVRFASDEAQFRAIVDVGDGPHTLPIRPWTTLEPQVVWSDGQRTLTWTAGVTLMWMEGSTHLMCGRGEAPHEH